jgi:hypothetical protein
MQWADVAAGVLLLRVTIGQSAAASQGQDGLVHSGN